MAGLYVLGAKSLHFPYFFGRSFSGDLADFCADFWHLVARGRISIFSAGFLSFFGQEGEWGDSFPFFVGGNNKRAFSLRVLLYFCDNSFRFVVAIMLISCGTFSHRTKKSGTFLRQLFTLQSQK